MSDSDSDYIECEDEFEEFPEDEGVEEINSQPASTHPWAIGWEDDDDTLEDFRTQLATMKVQLQKQAEEKEAAKAAAAASMEMDEKTGEPPAKVPSAETDPQVDDKGLDGESK